MAPTHNFKTSKAAENELSDKNYPRALMSCHGASMNSQNWISAHNGSICFTPKGIGQIQFRCSQNNDVVFRLYPNSIHHKNNTIENWILCGSKTSASTNWNGEKSAYSYDIEHKPVISLTGNSLHEWLKYISKTKVLPDDGIKTAKRLLELFMQQYTPSNIL